MWELFAGVCALAASHDSDNLMFAVNVYGSIYCINISHAPEESLEYFTIPEEHLMIKLLAKSKELNSIYELLAHEDSILAAISSAIAVRGIPNLFHLELSVLSG